MLTRICEKFFCTIISFSEFWHWRCKYSNGEKPKKNKMEKTWGHACGTFVKNHKKQLSQKNDDFLIFDQISYFNLWKLGSFSPTVATTSAVKMTLASGG